MNGRKYDVDGRYHLHPARVLIHMQVRPMMPFIIERLPRLFKHLGIPILCSRVVVCDVSRCKFSEKRVSEDEI